MTGLIWSMEFMHNTPAPAALLPVTYSMTQLTNSIPTFYVSLESGDNFMTLLGLVANIEIKSFFGG